MAGIQSSAGGLTSASSFSNHSDPGVAESQQSTDTEAQSLTTEQSLSGGLTTEERLKASKSPLEQFVSESTESVSEYPSNAWQGIKALDQEYALTQRGLGILKVLGGAGEAAVGAVGIVTPEPATTIGGGILFVHGADVASSGLKELWTGKPEETLTDQAVTEGAKMLGADEATAHQLGDGVDLSLSLGSCGVGIYHSLTRPVTAQLGPMTLKPKVVSESVDDLVKSELSTSPKTIMGVSDDAASSGRLEAQGLEKADGVSDVGATMRGGVVGPNNGFTRFTGKYDEHIVYRDYGVPRKRGIGGAHNRDEFLKYSNEYKIEEVVPHPSVDGVETIRYRMTALDPSGNPTGSYRTAILEKTVYDPKKISNEQFMDWGRQAAAEAQAAGKLNREWVGTAPNGLEFRGYLDDTGAVKSFFPNF
ncbi:MAG: CdiA family toxin C-terminal domain-containing protein [Candidatus Thiodiazotropha sp.]